MPRSNFFVDKTDDASIEQLLDGFGVRGSDYEPAIRAALGLHDQSFILFLDHVNRPDITPLDDPFTFNMETGELILFSEHPDALINAILEMAMFQRGFETMMNSGQEWQVQFAIGAWHFVRARLCLDLDILAESSWSVSVDPEAANRYNLITFTSMVYLAGQPDTDVVFPENTDAQIIVAYQRLRRMMSGVAHEIELTDSAIFNRRLIRTLRWIEESLLPSLEPSPFDELFGPDGLDERFFVDVQGN